jgi:hypothetical protein
MQIYLIREKIRVVIDNREGVELSFEVFDLLDDSLFFLEISES